MIAPIPAACHSTRCIPNSEMLTGRSGANSHRGDARLDNHKARATVGGKIRMMSSEEVLTLTGHPIGGVCPFGLATEPPVYSDVTLRSFDEVLPAAGSPHSALRINPLRMAELIEADRVDVCRDHGNVVRPSSS
jgi:prolyl-tRNA editing enzyme YbaK/EbsC (Cys-tRNA(Pro) deacylase)